MLILPKPVAAAQLVGSISNDSRLRAKLIEGEVMNKYEKMLHPPLTYLGDAFQYRAADGKFNSVLHPHLGQAGAPYAKSVPSKTHQLGALPDPGDIFDRLMAREEKGRNSTSGLSSMLIYHATIIIHDIFRTNDNDKNISDSSSYLDLSPLYGYNENMTRQIRDGKYKLGLLKPDTFAEDRLVRQPPGVCIMLVMYNRYHNYAATQLRRINENGRFSVPAKFTGPKFSAIAAACVPHSERDKSFDEKLENYQNALREYAQEGGIESAKTEAEEREARKKREAEANAKKDRTGELPEKTKNNYYDAVSDLRAVILEKATKTKTDKTKEETVRNAEAAYDAAWDKLDDDLFNTARL